jgi:crotonobetainyl-CoA:carnitine CoA-transferase CaiB-like acyl-CoA transferase
VRALVAGADVVQHNLRPGVAERLGIDAASLRRIAPELIYHYSPGYGSSGPKAMLQSFAPLLSGFVGLFAIGAGVGNRPHATFGNEDYYNGLLGACACLLAVVHRERTGQGQDVESPQLHSSLFTTSEYYKAGGEYRSVIPRVGGGLYGWATGYRLYQCLDDWICVTCTEDDQVAALARAVLPPDVLADVDRRELRADRPEVSALSELLEHHFVERMVAEWAGVLADHGVPCEAVRDGSWLAEESFHDAEMLASGRSIEVRHPERGRLRMIGDMVHPDRQRPAGKGRAPLLGEHTTDVLAAAGYTSDDVASLADSGAVRIAPPSTPT